MNMNRNNKLFNYDETMKSYKKSDAYFHSNFYQKNEGKSKFRYDEGDCLESSINMIDFRLNLDLVKLQIDKINYLTDNYDNKAKIKKSDLKINREYNEKSLINANKICQSEIIINNNFISRNLKNNINKVSYHHNSNISSDISIDLNEIVENIVEFKKENENLDKYPNLPTAIKKNNKKSFSFKNLLQNSNKKNIQENENIFELNNSPKDDFTYKNTVKPTIRSSNIFNKIISDNLIEINNDKLIEHEIFPEINNISSTTNIFETSNKIKSAISNTTIQNHSERLNLSAILNTEQYSRLNTLVNISNLDLQEIFNEEEDKEVLKNLAKQKLNYLIEQNEKEEKEGVDKSHKSIDSKSKLNLSKKEKSLCKKFISNPERFYTEPPSDNLLKFLNLYNNNNSKINNSLISSGNNNRSNESNKKTKKVIEKFKI